MNAREERGLVIAALCKLKVSNGAWIVPSQTARQSVTYRVNADAETCTCPDHTEHGHCCKHIHAVKFTLQRELRPDGTVIETESVTFTKQVTYKQNWKAYNEAQMTEKRRFQSLLAELCRGVTEPVQTRGRKRVSLADRLFASVFKVYCGYSSRRFATDLAEAYEKGHLSHLMHSCSTCAYLESADMSEPLRQLIIQASLPVRSIETSFGPDSTGFSASRFVRWFDEKYGVTRTGHDWCKAHAMVGTTTNIVTAIEIHGRHEGDSNQFKPLCEATAQNFNMQEVSADKAYLSHDNLAMVNSLGATPFIPFKSNSRQGEPGSLWEKMYLYYAFRREDFLQHYHRRSNVESTFSMVKAKFGDSVRSKTQTAVKNEVLAKFLCHNICVVIQSQCELGIEPIFWAERVSEQPALRVLPMK